jgi:hypothetical protein
MRLKKLASALLGLFLLLSVAGCNQADEVSHNIGQEADKFNIARRIVFYNGITDAYMLTIEGYCSLGNDRTEFELSVTCKVGPGDNYKKHFLGRSDNVTYFVEQLDAAHIDPNHYKVVFKPTFIIPDIEIR